jgi:hypothetical protein
MRKIILLSILLMAFSFTTFAQLNSMRNPTDWVPTSSGLATDKPQVSGCVSKNASGQGFILTNAKFKEGVPVASNKDLASEVGHTVTLTGAWKKMPASGDSKGEKVKTFDASQIDKVADNCKQLMKDTNLGVRTSIGSGTP